MADISQEIQINGRLDSEALKPWITRHATKLGVTIAITGTSPTQVSLYAHGPAEMLRALVLGCSLGPYDVWIDTVTTSPVDPAHRRA